MRIHFALLVLLIGFGLSGCSPERGSAAWCEAMDETPKGEWSANDVADYAKHCVLRSGATAE